MIDRLIILIALATVANVQASWPQADPGREDVWEVAHLESGVDSGYRLLDDPCETCYNDPAGTVHSFFGGSCSDGEYCYKCEWKSSCSEEQECHWEFQEGECSECHEICGGGGGELTDAVLLASQDPEAIVRLLSKERGTLTFNADRNAIQAICGTHVILHVPLSRAVVRALLHSGVHSH